MCGSSIIRAINAADVAVVEVSSCKQDNRCEKMGESRI